MWGLACTFLCTHPWFKWSSFVNSIPINFSIIIRNPKYSPCTQPPWTGLWCFPNNTKKISHKTTNWGVTTTYVGSDVYFFVCTWLTQVKFTYILNFQNYFQSLKARQTILHARNLHEVAYVVKQHKLSIFTNKWGVTKTYVGSYTNFFLYAMQTSWKGCL